LDKDGLRMGCENVTLFLRKPLVQRQSEKFWKLEIEMARGQGLALLKA
jgi:hypothetical protein